ncbi:hypothetical protein P153DRAFT_388946 [Dothidotthia symphoricarpi CBS 119687]|uniref:DUF6536 domain-containing protein n=1 Tax=Dothidotthia symphoricarpi CBS 119687 TaxID=1392245 RepID=A0A6A6A4W0_9PLEO|nr:uncharacterized protein P153DRAFT_388946 [Dothidotthia symphoricarpi CBS 119687]KAF2126203.1 hypothetical protein P153DRAFT_388946 [Dothidotthia symphoricarpi CBS 119687]
MTVWVWKNPGNATEGYLGTLYMGNCARTRKINVWIHLIINIISTLLLSASNYCMQVLSAPSRKELARAHAQRYWLQIGIPSLRNLRHIGWDRVVLWALLLLSSAPLHLLFNSVVFTSLQANEYVVIPTMDDWLHGGVYNTSSFVDIDAKQSADVIDKMSPYRPNLNDTITLSTSGTRDRYKNISTVDCFNAYNDQYLSSVGHVYLVQDDPVVWRNRSWYPEFKQYTEYPKTTRATGNFTWINLNQPPPWNETVNSTLWGTRPYTVTKPHDYDLITGYHSTSYEERNYSTTEWAYAPDGMKALDLLDEASYTLPFFSLPDTYPSNGWRCSSHVAHNCSIDNQFEVPQDRSKWEPYGRPIKYCMVEQVEEVCRLRFSFPIAIAVIISNIIKALCVAFMLIKYRNHEAVVTLGDAIAHYLDQPDTETRGRCLQTRELLETEWSWESAHGIRKDETDIKPVKFKPDSHRWSKAPPPGRWFLTYVAYIITIILGVVCSILSLKDMPSNAGKLWKIGFGIIQSNNLLSFRRSLMASVLIANSPQAALSYLYLAFNALCTSMLIAREWSTYTHKRKPLRVTSPVGQQRSTYWLNVPFRYAIPMTLVSLLFHWLASQSIFMVHIMITDAQTRNISGQITTCGYSPMAIILTTAIGSMIAVGGLAIGNLRYPAGIPLASSCSAAISAACHPPSSDVDASLYPVQWGVVASEKQDPDGEEPVGHCSFSSGPVEYPTAGRLYA